MPNKTLLHRVFHITLKEITPEKLIEASCRLDGQTLTVLDHQYDLGEYRNIYLLGSGKAIVPMALGMEKLLKPLLKKILIIGPYSSEVTFENGHYRQSTHPLPSHKSMSAAISMQETLCALEKEDLFIYLLSGGNSALVELPEADISLNEFQEVTRLMLHSGMPIEKMNCVRKHLSQVKGGKLAEVSQAKGVVLVLSDVIGDDLYTIGSAPFYCDQTTFQEAEEALRSYGLLEKIPKSVQMFLGEGKEGLHNETPKIPHAHIDHHILGSNRIVLKKAQEILEKEGIETTIVDEPLRGPVGKVAEKLLEFTTYHHEKTHAYVFGGETTVVVTGEGKGGRNQHLCLSLLMLLDGSCNVTFLSGATDGIDGNSNAAGALINIHSCVDAKTHHVDPQHYLESFDSNSFFAQTRELLITGPTHNNLLDVMIMLILPKPTQRDKHG